MTDHPTILLIGTCDTKWAELQHTRQQLLSSPVHPSPSVILLDIGREPSHHDEITIPHPSLPSQFDIDINNDDHEPKDWASLPRQSYLEAATARTRRTIAHLRTLNQLHGILALGGSCGTTVATAAMRAACPIGFPKVMVSTMASGDIGPYVEETDLTMMYSVVDIAGTNSILTRILDNAAAAAAAMAAVQFRREQQQQQHPQDDPTAAPKRIGITMFGVTTPCVTEIQTLLAASPTAAEVFIFHATGAGGKAMERLIREGRLDAVIDLTTSEVVDELVGGVLSAGPERLDAAAAMGIPQVVSVGACDMVNYGPPGTVPERFRGRRIWEHNPTVTLVRTSPEENQEVGGFLVGKLRRAKVPEKVVVVLPTRGLSMLDVEGGVYWDPEADGVLFRTVEEGLKGSGVEVVRREEEVNDPAFARGLVEALGRVMGCQLV
ncbi:hypothetical protein ASPACDRAFT_43026 [Aspergillus aculeatus ATCC 16872]|uniref:Uncharacterized protein n=1 Tax=Aspergillus aculeatus (strain ATCC 16872 / CBS 172.66 / WB 5094) TaxID=690307 RepID=A0A1L9WW87_ASPA1|nr:uncharacterized protein ASPACDRAFT_43026 [Aspergillus aculeatus ATCC 16872]OJK00439.1 hypothetical protein ASPACDRAFT_43026 [Aspergillus aculeatus ATCC 16872]